MKINEKHSAVILERVFDSQDKYELIDLVSSRGKERIPIHRVILMAASEFFANLLRTKYSDEKPEELYFDLDGEAIKTVVDFCYSGYIDLTEQNVRKYLQIAVNMKIDLLLTHCHDYFAAKLSIETVVDVLLVADKYSLDDLQRRASELLCSDLEQVPVNHVLQLNPALMLNLMENVDEAVSSDLIAKRLLSWFQYAEAARGEHMPIMLRMIRLKQLTAEFLCKTIEPLFKQFKCTDLLYNEFMRRTMYPTPCSDCLSVKAVPNEKSAVFWVAEQLEYSSNPNDLKINLIVERFDESLNQFTPQHTPLSIGRGYSSYILYENKIFATGCKVPITFDLKNGKKEELLPMNSVRNDHTVILMGKSLYVIGGRDGNGVSSSCERYDTEKGTWQTIKSMNHKRRNASAAILNGLIYVVGGRKNSFKTISSVESYDSNTDEWTERTALDVGICQAPLVAFNGMLYAFVDGHEVSAYDPVENVWRMLHCECLFRSVVSADGSLFGLTYDNRFGKLAISKGLICFEEHTKVDIPKRCDLLSLQHCQYEE